MTVIVDTGVLVAMLDPDTGEHEWAKGRARRSPIPLVTSEAVLSETCFLLEREGRPTDDVFALVESGSIRVALVFQEEYRALRALMRSYRNVPMSLADATLVRLSEMVRDCKILTLDSDFLIYRRHRNESIPVLMPEK